MRAAWFAATLSLVASHASVARAQADGPDVLPAPRVSFSGSGQADWDALPPSVADALVPVIEALAEEPFGPRTFELEGPPEGARRIRTLGDTRVDYLPWHGGGIRVLRISRLPIRPPAPASPLTLGADNPCYAPLKRRNPGLFGKLFSRPETKALVVPTLEDCLALGDSFLVRASYAEAAAAYGRAPLPPDLIAFPLLARAEAYERGDHPAHAARSYEAFIASTTPLHLGLELAPIRLRIDWLDGQASRLFPLGGLLAGLGGVGVFAASLLFEAGDLGSVFLGLLIDLIAIPVLAVAGVLLTLGTIAMIRSTYHGGVEPPRPPALEPPPAWRSWVHEPVAPTSPPIPEPWDGEEVIPMPLDAPAPATESKTSAPNE